MAISHILEPDLSKQLPDTGNFVEEVFWKKMSLFWFLYTSIEATSNRGVVGFNCGKVVWRLFSIVLHFIAGWPQWDLKEALWCQECSEDLKGNFRSIEEEIFRLGIWNHYGIKSTASWDGTRGGLEVINKWHWSYILVNKINSYVHPFDIILLLA